MKIDILGVKIDRVTMDEVLKIVSGWLKQPGKRYIVTPNPEFIVAAQTDLSFRKILNDADLAIPDGVGLKIATDIENISPGIDVMEELVKLAQEKGFTVAFLGGRDEVAKKTAECLLRKYPNLKINYVSSGGIIGKDGNSQNTKYKIPNTDLLFVALGHIKQEKWIAKNLPNLPVKVAMGVGGAFDYFSGSVPRAPKWLRGMGFEWLFRLIVQPWRIKRQLTLFKFIFYILRSCHRRERSYLKKY